MAALTGSQLDHLDAIKRLGGTVEYNRVRWSFTTPGSVEPIRGLNRTTIENLVKLGKLDLREESPDHATAWIRVYSIAKRRS